MGWGHGRGPWKGGMVGWPMVGGHGREGHVREGDGRERV